MWERKCCSTKKWDFFLKWFSLPRNAAFWSIFLWQFYLKWNISNVSKRPFLCCEIGFKYSRSACLAQTVSSSTYCVVCTSTCFQGLQKKSPFSAFFHRHSSVFRFYTAVNRANTAVISQVWRLFTRRPSSDCHVKNSHWFLRALKPCIFTVSNFVLFGWCRETINTTNSCVWLRSLEVLSSINTRRTTGRCEAQGVLLSSQILKPRSCSQKQAAQREVTRSRCLLRSPRTEFRLELKGLE